MVEQFGLLGLRKKPVGENADIWGVCMVVLGFRWGLGWSQMVEIEVGDTIKLS